jgi:hypothetical protein
MKYHLAMSVDGALRNTDRELKGVFQFDDGTPMTPHQARQSLRIEKMKGRKVIPCSPCDNFDYEKGCLGHAD